MKIESSNEDKLAKRNWRSERAWYDKADQNRAQFVGLGFAFVLLLYYTINRKKNINNTTNANNNLNTNNVMKTHA